MGRSYAPLHTAIWLDEDFRKLSALAQRVYLLANSQPNISYAGVVPYTARRWARMATDTSVGDIDQAVDELAAMRFVVLDEDTEELLIRSFVKHNGVLKQPQLRKAMRVAAAEIQSPVVRGAFLAELPADERSELANVQVTTPSEPCGQGDDEPAARPLDASPAGSGLGLVTVSSDPEPEPVTEPRPESPLAPPSATAEIVTLPPQSIRRRDDLFEALMGACCIELATLTDSSRGAYNKALKELRNVGATPADVHQRAGNYRLHMPHATLTPSALAKHWALCANPPRAQIRGADVFSRFIEEGSR